MENVTVLRGTVPDDGDGCGCGDGGCGDGGGGGGGYGYGCGGYGEDIVSATPLPVVVTAKEHLRGACRSQLDLFLRTFPDGATWPTDIERACAAGLDVAWAQTHLGLIAPK